MCGLVIQLDKQFVVEHSRLSQLIPCTFLYLYYPYAEILLYFTIFSMLKNMLDYIKPNPEPFEHPNPGKNNCGSTTMDVGEERIKK